ncbi:DMT family transporter [Glutamicibacter sp.]|uniref:DMT family transporter n=1 Tax=Glutamicibacter sp. TaxID=1931995 RepID=UPI0028BEF90A|nr:DMT family transporter [Glutamicibacter sp.]
MHANYSAKALVPDLLLIAVAATWGGSYLSAKNLVAATDVNTALTLRYAVALIGMLIFLLIRRSAVLSRRVAFLGFGLGLSQAAILWLETSGVGLTSSSNAGVLISLSLILTPLLEVLVLRRILPKSFYLMALLAMLGAFLLASVDGLRIPGSGDLLVVAAALVRAVHVIATAKFVQSGDDLPLIVGLQIFTGLAIFTCLSASELAVNISRMGGPAWADAIFLGLACSVFAFLVQAWAVRRSSASRASLLMGTEPIWAVAIGVSFGGDRVGPVQALGIVFIVVATVVGARIERRARERRMLLLSQRSERIQAH